MIIDLQRRLAEVGRIRIGQQVKTARGSRPAKLDTFRLTSPDRNRIDAAARLYGGTVNEWEAPAGPQWQVITGTDTLPVVVPPTDMCFSQWYELWSGGGCQRRCDGHTESISDGACLCDPEMRDCKIHSRLSVMLRDLPGLGVWRIDSSGFYAGGELQGAMEIVKLAAGRGQMLPASLRLEQRMIKRANDPVKRFAVPVLDLAVSPAQLLSGGDPLDAGTLAIEPTIPQDGSQSPTGLLTPVPDTVPEEPVPSIAEQATGEKPKRKPRKNAAQKIPATGVKPRTAEQAAKDSRQQVDQHSPPPVPAAGPDPERAEPADPPAQTDEPEPPRADENRAKLNRNMHAVFNEANITQRDDRLTITKYMAHRHDLQTSSQLSDVEMRTVVDKLNEWKRDGVLTEKMVDVLEQASIDQQTDDEGQYQL